MITKKSIIDDIIILLADFNVTDDSRLDNEYISYKIDEIRAQLIREQYKVTNVIDQTWLQDLGVVAFHNVNFADDPTVSCCECDISKAFIPQIVSLENGNGNQDLGLNVLATCGKKKYYPYSLSIWKDVPANHTRSLFNYYSRINTALYVNKDVDKLRIYGILQNPEDGFVKNSTPIASGSIATGIVYLVKGAQIIYNGNSYAVNATFTGVVGITTYTGSGTIYLNAQAQAFVDTDAYPVTGDMARAIVVEICTKEFKIEQAGLAADVKNNSRDDKFIQSQG